MCCVFLCFEAISGLRFNLAKSEIVPVGEVGDIEELVHILDCRVFSLPLKYLGLPLGASYKEISIWSGIIEKMECQLTGRKKIYLSKGVRLTMVKSTLFNLLYIICLFSLFQWEWLISLRDLQGIFLWGSIRDEVKFNLVIGARICSLIKSSGLGVRNLIKFSRALLGKLLWWYAMDTEAL
jgi:hypothetical protein